MAGTYRGSGPLVGKVEVNPRGRSWEPFRAWVQRGVHLGGTPCPPRRGCCFPERGLCAVFPPPRNRLLSGSNRLRLSVVGTQFRIFGSTGCFRRERYLVGCWFGARGLGWISVIFFLFLSFSRFRFRIRKKECWSRKYFFEIRVGYFCLGTILNVWEDIDLI